MTPSIVMPRQCREVLKRFGDAGYSAYLVGGCVRDSLLGKTPLDWDICTSARPEETLALFAGCKVILTGLKHGTVTLLWEQLPLEITTYRIDGEYLDNRRPQEVFFTEDLREDLSRRDFTINAMAYNPEMGLVDYFGGAKDLKERRICAVGDALARYHEDGLRLMRAVRFACVLNFDYDEKTRQAIVACNYLLRNIAMERIQAELNKILLSPYVAKGLDDLYTLGCFAYFMPEICHTVGFEQHNPYHCYDVFGHLRESVAAIEPDLVLRLTMLLHDIGKPFVWCSCYGDSDCFPGHEAISAKLAEAILSRLCYDKATQREVVKLVKHHTYMLHPEAENVRRALAFFGEASLRRLLKVKEADLRAQKVSVMENNTLFMDITQVLEQVLAQGDCYSLKQLAVNGEDMKRLGYQGQGVGRALDRLLEQVLKTPALNTRAQLIALAQQDLESEKEQSDDRKN